MNIKTLRYRYILKYINKFIFMSDDSLSEDDTKTTALSTSQVQKATAIEGSCNSISRKTKTIRKLTRQAQLKRYVNGKIFKRFYVIKKKRSNSA